MLVTEAEFQKAMEFSREEPAAAICQHIFSGLGERGLSEGGLSIVAPNERIPKHPAAPFRYFYPTILGIELFMWGLGYGDQTIDAFTPDLLQDDSLPATMAPLHLELGRVNY